MINPDNIEKAKQIILEIIMERGSRPFHYRYLVNTRRRLNMPFFTLDSGYLDDSKPNGGELEETISISEVGLDLLKESVDE